VDAIVVIITLLGIILLSSSLHEAMHAYVSFRLGDDTAMRAGRLSLNPLVHIDPLLSVALPFFLAIIGAPIFGAAKPVPFNPYRVRWSERGAALVAVSGPLTNFLLAAVIALPLRVVDLPAPLVRLSVQAILINLGFFVFNMLPLPPLDGSRLLYAFAPQSIRSAMENIERSGLLFVGLAVILFSGVFSPFLLAALGWLFRLLTGSALGSFAII
jgi:Zn-dependent protease